MKRPGGINSWGRRRRRGASDVEEVNTTLWYPKASYRSTADSANLVRSGSDVTGWPNKVSGGPNPGHDEGIPSVYPQYATTNFGGKGEVNINGATPLYFPDTTFGSLSGIWGGLVVRLGPGSESGSRVLLGGGSQFGLGLDSGVLAVFDGSGYKPVPGATCPIDEDCSLLWLVGPSSTSVEVFINGVSQGAAAIDGNIGADNLNLTIGGYNKVAGGDLIFRACHFGLTALNAAEIASLLAFQAAELS